jgi:hypothetical protein
MRKIAETILYDRKIVIKIVFTEVNETNYQ